MEFGIEKCYNEKLKKKNSRRNRTDKYSIREFGEKENCKHL